METGEWVRRQRYGFALDGPALDPFCGDPPRRLRDILARIPSEVVERFSGCGSPVPEAIEGRRVVDLGCGTGRDAYLCAALVGPSGFVMGLDREEQHLALARRNVEPAMGALGYAEPNIAFRKGSIEAMAEAGIEDECFDVAISNRALNLVPDKLRVLREVFRVLMPGGEFYFSDVYADRRLPEEVAREPEVIREQLGGALYVGDLVRLARRAGFIEPRIVARCPLALADPDLQARLGGVQFWAVTFRLFKVLELEDGEEDYGQAALYRGTIHGCAHHFILDADNQFETGRIRRVGGNTALILQRSRLAPHFKVFGSRNRHFGPFVGPA
ncbi:MAG: methyltransferase domain-containing protein [Deltaproteobacteria bacterium]|nr:methyltransferase domain-containing protein [Deltaproteobacteria bacterium]